MQATNERKAIRRLMRERRHNLDETRISAASEQLRNRLVALPRFRHARNLAAYLAVHNEMPLDPVINAAWSLNIPVYLPCLHGTRMEFRRFTPETPLHENRFGIPEPENAPGSRLNAKFLDIVLAPMVAFDEAGGRLGTGGGYYDRTFGFLRDRKYWKQPTLIGVGYEFQRVPALRLAPWDVRLDAVVTEEKTREFGSGSGS